MIRQTPSSTRTDTLFPYTTLFRSHSAADTHCHHDVPGATPFPLDQGMADHTRTGHAVGMRNRDGAAADVESFDGNTEAILAIEHLHRKGFVQFPEPDVIDAETETLSQLGKREHRDRKSTRQNSSHYCAARLPLSD